MALDVSQIRLVLLSPTHESIQSIQLCREAFRLWHAVWTATFRELDGTDMLYSDDFTRQSCIVSLFHHEKCVTLGMLHHVDFTTPAGRLDSYFRVWPDSAIQRLTKDGPRVTVGSNITVDPQFRGDLGSGVFLKNLLIPCMVRVFSESDDDSLTGTMRVNRNMHLSAYLFGAESVSSGIVHHGVEVDLVAFYRRTLDPRIFNPDIHVARLWRERTDIRFANSSNTIRNAS